MQVIKQNETTAASNTNGKPVLSDKPYVSAYVQPTMLQNAFFAASFHPVANGPTTEWPKIPYAGVLPESVHNALTKAGEKVAAGAEFVAASACRGIDHTVTFVGELFDNDSVKVKLTREGADEEGFFTKTKTTIAGWFSKDDKKAPAAKSPTLTIVKAEPAAPATKEQLIEAAALVGTLTARVAELGLEKATLFLDAGEQILEKHNHNAKAARDEVGAFLSQFALGELKMSPAEAQELVAASALLADNEELAKSYQEDIENALDVSKKERVLHHAVTLIHEAGERVLNKDVGEATIQTLEVAAVTQATVIEGNERMIQANEDALEHSREALAQEQQTTAIIGETVQQFEQREMATADGGGFSGTPDATMSDTLNEQYVAKFGARFDAIRQSMAFDPEWLGDDGGLDAMYESNELRKLLSPGFQIKCVDSRGRKVVVTGTAVGPVIAYEEVAGGHQLCFIAPPAIKRTSLIRSQGKYLNADEIELVVGSADGKKVVNIGKSVGMLFQHAKEVQQ